MGKFGKTAVYIPDSMVSGKCGNCQKDIHVGNCVVSYDDGYEFHWDCERPFRFPKIPPSGTDDDPKCYILAGDPMIYVDPYVCMTGGKK